MHAISQHLAVEEFVPGDREFTENRLNQSDVSNSGLVPRSDRRAEIYLLCMGFILSIAMTMVAGAAREAYSQEAGQQAVTSRPLVEQKLKLLENVLSSPKMSQIEAGRDADGVAQVYQARRWAEEARGALAAGDVQRAGTLLDLALKACSAASLRSGRSAEEDAHLRARNREMLDEIMSYRVSLGEAARERGGDREEAELGRIDQMIARALEFTAANRQTEAGKLLHHAYGLAVGLLSELRAGQTIVLRLKFDSPADELAHERKTHDGNAALVHQMMREDKINPERRPHLDRYLQESLAFRARADELASRGDFPAAIKLMEKANEQLLNAVMSASGLTSF